jgi:hypothetical protein
MGPAAAVAMNITKLQQVLMRAGGLGQTPEAAMRTFMLHPEQMAGRAMEINQLAQALQLSPEDIPKLRTSVLAGAGAEIQDALKGALPTEEYKKIAGYLGMGAGASKEDVVKRLQGSTDDQAKAMEGLAGDWDTFTQIWQRGGTLSKTLEESAKAQGLEFKTQAARDLGMALTDTNQYLKEISDFLKNQIFGLMTDILESIPGHKVNAAEQSRKVAEKEQSRGVREDTSAILKSMTGEMGEFGPRATVQTDIEKAKNVQANLQAEVDRLRGDVAEAKDAANKPETVEANKRLVEQRAAELTKSQADLQAARDAAKAEPTAANKAMVGQLETVVRTRSSMLDEAKRAAEAPEKAVKQKEAELADRRRMLSEVGVTIDTSQKALEQFKDYEAGKAKMTEPQAQAAQGVFEQLQHRMGADMYKPYYHPGQAVPKQLQPGAAATSPAVEGVKPAADRGTSIKTTTVSNSVTMGLAQAAPAKPTAPEKSTEKVNPDTSGVAKAVVEQHNAASTRTMVQ